MFGKPRGMGMRHETAEQEEEVRNILKAIESIGKFWRYGEGSGMLRDVLWESGTRALRFRYSSPIGRVMQSAKER
ncbi:hypothetical protein Tco_1401105 [Tanacetum coccineum]